MPIVWSDSTFAEDEVGDRGPLGHRDQKPGYGDKADGEAPWFILKL